MLRWGFSSTSRKTKGVPAPDEDGSLGQGEVAVEMESLLSAKAHASPMVKDSSDVVLVFDDDKEPETRRLHADDNEHLAAARKGHVTGGAVLPETSRIFMGLVILLAFAFFLAILSMLPRLETVDEGDQFLWRPKATSDFELDKRVLIRYRNEHAWQLLVGMAVVYIILQTFCVPASGTSMNILAGCIFSETVPAGEYLIALPMAIMCVSLGAVMCYLISYLSLREVVTRNFPNKVQWLKLKMADLRPMNMVLFFVSLRVSPVVPAYLLNLAAPVTPLPLFHFWLATILGCAPHALVSVTAGATLSRLQPGEDVVGNNLGLIVFLLVLSICVALIPSAIKRFAPASMAAAQSHA